MSGLEGYILERTDYSGPTIGKGQYCPFSLNTGILADCPTRDLFSVVAGGTQGCTAWSGIVRHCRAVGYYFLGAAGPEYRLFRNPGLGFWCSRPRCSLLVVLSVGPGNGLVD